MAHKRDRVQEILAVKNRRQRREFELGVNRLRILKQEITKLGDQSELLRYFPIAFVTAIEVQIKQLVQELVDEGPPYLERAAKLTADAKFDLRLISEIAGRTITIGEIVAHLIRVSSLPDIDHALSVLTGTDFLKDLPKVTDWYKTKATGAAQPAYLQEPGTTLSTISSLFETRHVLVHELPDEVSVKKEDILSICSHAEIFLTAATSMIENLLIGHMSIRVSDWREERLKRRDEMRQSLTEVTAMIRGALSQLSGEPAAAKFDIAQDAWNKFVEADTRWYEEIGKGDPLVASFTTQREIELVLSRKGELIDPYKEIVARLQSTDDDRS